MDATTTTPSWDRTRRDANTDSAPSTRGVRGKPTSIHACLNVLVFAVCATDKRQGSPVQREETEQFYTTCYKESGCRSSTTSHLIAENMQPLPTRYLAKLCI